MTPDNATPLAVTQSITIVLPKVGNLKLVVERLARFKECLLEIRNDLQNLEEAGALNNNSMLSKKMY